MRRSPSETWMFSVVFWYLCSWLLCLADWQVSCSRYVVQLQQNICHQNDREVPVNTSDRALSPRREPEGASRTFWGEMNMVGQIARYFDSTWYTKLAILNSTRRLTGNQWSWRNIGVMCSRRFAPVISLAAAFCTDCTCRMSLSVTPYSSELQ